MEILFMFFCGLFGLAYGSECSIVANEVSETDAQSIVDMHNDLRKLIANGEVPGQPRGVNLKKMKYDHDLAREAQKIADTCVFEHKKVFDDRWPAKVGQNLYQSSSDSTSNQADWESAIQVWFDEYEYYKFGPYGSNNSGMTGHYTQMVWADNEYVGCGYTFFTAPGIMKYKKLYVCNYGPGGNFPGQLPYKVGTSGCENLC